MSPDLAAGSCLFVTRTHTGSRVANIEKHTHTHKPRPIYCIKVASAEMKRAFSVPPLNFHSSMPSQMTAINTSNLGPTDKSTHGAPWIQRNSNFC